MGYPVCLYGPVSYPKLRSGLTSIVTPHRKESEKLARKSRDEIGGKDCETLQDREPLITG